MKSIRRGWFRVAVTAAVSVALVACNNNEFGKSASPVDLLVSNSAALQRIDLLSGSSCATSVGTINIAVIQKNATAVSQYNQVRLTRYSVTYVRTDGGKQVPAPFTRTLDVLLPSSTNFVLLQTEAVNQAPFAALLPVNGGRDPDTGRTTVQLDIVFQVFGETLAGEPVSGTTRIPLEFCYDCGGCV
jgi:hypothetical protein